MSDEQSLHGLPPEPSAPIELPPRLRTVEQQAQLQQQLGEAAMRREQSQELLFSRLWDEDDTREPAPDFMERLLSRVTQDRQQLEQSMLPQQPVNFSNVSGAKPASKRSAWLEGVGRGRALPRWVPALALSCVLLVLFAIPRLHQGSPEDEQLRTRGAEKLRLELLMESVAEQPDGSLQPVKTGAVLNAHAGLVFQFQAGGGTHLTLLEQTPQNQLNLLLTRSELEGSTRLQTIQILDEGGRALKYTPDDGPGTYFFFGVLSQEPLTITEDLREALHAVRDGHGSPALERHAWRIEVLKVRFEGNSEGNAGESP